MSDELALRKDVERATRAEALIADDLLAEAFRGLEEAYRVAWLNTEARDTDARERLWQATQLIGKVQSHLTSIIIHGRVAKAELDTIANHKRPKAA